ncbi:MAG TPA: ABC transporter permease [Opitutaceae bacterium]|jgi:predicted permease
MLKDLRFALRMAATHPWYSGAVAVTLALCIGANTTVFTLISAAYLRPVPVPRGDRLVAIEEKDPGNPGHSAMVSLPAFLDFQAQARTFAQIEGCMFNPAVIVEPGIPAASHDMGAVSTGLFAMLGTRPALGRDLVPGDGRRGAAPVALISDSLWKERYRGSADIVGRLVTLNGVKTTIIGVMPPGFRFPTTLDVWTPLVPTPDLENRSHRDLLLFGILGKGRSLAEAQADLAVVSGRLAMEFPATDKEADAYAQTFQDKFNGGPIRAVFLLLQGAVAFVLLIGCANVANMMLGRALARRREIAVRAAIGASRLRIIRQLLVESVFLSVVGGGLGLFIAQFGVRAFDLATRDVGRPYWVQFSMDWRAFAFFAAVSAATGLLFGMAPALKASRVDLTTALKDGSLGSGSRSGRLTAILVVFQFALTVVLLDGAGLMLRRFEQARHMNAFVPSEHLLTARINLPDMKGDRYESDDSRRRFRQALLNRLGDLPGVTQAALTSNFPGMGADPRDIEVEGRPADHAHPLKASAIFASPGYLDEIGLPVLRGRALSGTDGAMGKEAAVVTRQFSDRYWASGGGLGRRFRFVSDGKPGPWITVVGICANIVQDTMSSDPAPLAYLSDRQEPWGWIGILLRTPGDPASVAASARAAIQALDPDLPLSEVRTLPGAIEHEHWFLRVFGSLFLIFASIALVLASVGIYSVVAQATVQRTREIGIRMAIGASARQVVALMLSRGLAQLGMGVAAGLALAFGAVRLMAKLPGVMSPDDPLVLATVTLLLLAVGTLACWIPARRSARIAPVEALRSD